MCNDESYHVDCFFELHHPRTDADFDGFAHLRHSDQLAIKEHNDVFVANPLNRLTSEKNRINFLIQIKL